MRGIVTGLAILAVGALSLGAALGWSPAQFIVELLNGMVVFKELAVVLGLGLALYGLRQHAEAGSTGSGASERETADSQRGPARPPMGDDYRQLLLVLVAVLIALLVGAALVAIGALLGDNL